MDLLAQKRVLFVLMAAVVAASPGVVHAGVDGEDLYHFSCIDYFSLKARKEKKALASPVWLEAGQHPPKVVVDLLEDPNEETARHYLEWNRARLARIARAQRLVEETEQVMAGEPKP